MPPPLVLASELNSFPGYESGETPTFVGRVWQRRGQPPERLVNSKSVVLGDQATGLQKWAGQ